MARFTLTIDCNNDAFEYDLPGEVARIMRNLGSVIGDISLFPGDTSTVWDVNGNIVGRWRMEE